MKILYVTTVGITMTFFRALIQELMESGHTIEIACNETESKVPDCYREWGCEIHPISWTRSPLDKANWCAVKELKALIIENKYDIVHCHTPIAAACTRLACKGLRKSGLKVFYTAHGFHFYEGAPVLNWLIYYPIEWICSFWTDTLITINQEDFQRAKRKFHAKRTEYVPGVGIDVDKFANTVVDRKRKRHEINVPDDAFLLLSVGELNRNKNHEVVIRALAKLHNENIHYAIAGQGELHDYLLNIANELGIGGQIHLLGFRNDVAELYKAADVNVLPSIREGFPVAMQEGWAAGLPLICSDNRGTRAYAVNGENSFVCKPNDVQGFAQAIKVLSADYDKRVAYVKRAKEIAKAYSLNSINKQMKKIYNID